MRSPKAPRVPFRFQTRAMLVIATFVGAIGVAGSVASPSIAAAPSAFLAPSAAARELEFTASELRLHRDPATGRNFWYFTYDVVNRTGSDQRFAPRIEMLTDEGRIVAQGANVPGNVVKDLKKFLGNPLLEDQFEILGEVQQGKEHAKTGLVVFEATDLEPTELTVFVQGLSRETKKEPHPATGQPVTLRKSLRLDYLVPGDPRPVGTDTFPVLTREWTFR